MWVGDLQLFQHTCLTFAIQCLAPSWYSGDVGWMMLLLGPGVLYASIGLLAPCPLLDCKLVEDGSLREKWTNRVTQRVGQWTGLESRSPNLNPVLFSLHLLLSQSIPISPFPESLSAFWVRAMHSCTIFHLSWVVHELFQVCSACLSNWTVSAFKAESGAFSVSLQWVTSVQK